MDFGLDIDDDMDVVDGRVTLRLTRKGEQRLTIATGEVHSLDLILDIPGCLINMLSGREMSSVRQVFQRGMSITDDKLKLIDTSMDLPARPVNVPGADGNPVETPFVVRNDDVLTEICDDGSLGREWTIVAYDLTTFGTRWHLACRSLT